MQRNSSLCRPRAAGQTTGLPADRQLHLSHTLFYCFPCKVFPWIVSFSSQADGGDVTPHAHVRPRPQSPGPPGQAWQGLGVWTVTCRGGAGTRPGTPGPGMWKGLDPSGTPGCEVQPRPARGEAASGWLPRDGLDSPGTAGCSRHDSPGGRRGGDGRPRPEFLCVQPSRHRLGPGPQPRHGGDPCPAASHAAAAERVSAACAAEPGLVPLALRPPSRGAQPNPRWARPSSPAPGRPVPSFRSFRDV